MFLRLINQEINEKKKELNENLSKSDENSLPYAPTKKNSNGFYWIQLRDVRMKNVQVLLTYAILVSSESVCFYLSVCILVLWLNV